ncbi:MAG TPA: carboxypeptidase-like regulatory domain-containing protein [Solirubrobacteraceae bacterium]|nr:carboxypeptidase-like regulatory domain-containing protein [Solirubrobacteraceae bacterium]
MTDPTRGPARRAMGAAGCRDGALLPESRGRARRRRGCRIAGASLVVLGLLACLCAPPPAAANTTNVKLPVKVVWGIIGGPGELGCEMVAVVRFPLHPGAEHYVVSFSLGPKYGDRVDTFEPPPFDDFKGSSMEPPPGMQQIYAFDDVVGGNPEVYKQCEKMRVEEEPELLSESAEAVVTGWEASGRLTQQACSEGDCKTIGAAKVKLTAEGEDDAHEAVKETTESNAAGEWSMTLPQGSYQLSPEGTGWKPEKREFDLEQNLSELDFSRSELTLSGRVVGSDGKGVPGATALLQETVEGKLDNSTTTTNAEGRFSEQLPSGTVTVTVKSLEGNEFFPDPSKDCKVSRQSCEVDLNEDRSVEFSTCVVPNPNGEALPADTPNPIPGAKTAGQLEAVGCWKPENASGGGEPTIYTSTKPVRLDGVDVEPLPGTTLQLDTAGPTVNSNGPAKVLVHGWPLVGGIVPPVDISLNYQGGSQLSVSDQGASTGPAGLGVNLFGLPISLGTGTSAGYGLPFSESIGSPETGGGQTTINGGIQIPLNSHATWDPLAGVFKEATPSEVFTGGSVLDEKGTVPSLGFGGSFSLTNRLGLTGKLCVSLNDISTEFMFPFPRNGWDDGEISGATFCYLSAQGLWEGTGMFKLPSALAKAVGDIFVKLTMQKAKPSENGQFLGYKVQNFGLQFEHLRTETFQFPELGEVRSSGIPIGEGFFLQSLGGEFSNDVNTGKVSEIKGTMGISFGPEINIAIGKNLKGNELSLLRGDLEFALLPSGPEITYWTYRMAGALTFARLSPAELQLASAKVVFHANPTSPETDFSGQLGGSVLGTGAVLNVSGQAEGSNFLMEGAATVKAFGRYGTLDAVLNNYLLGVCLSANGEPLLGFTENLAALEEPAKWGCNLGAFKHPNGASSAAVHHVVHLRLRRGLAATVLAVRGSSGAPSVRLSRPGGSITATPSARPRGRDGAIVFADATRHVTYIGLLHPRAGRWTLRALGRSAIAGVLQADHQPTPRVHARVVRHGCLDELRYRVRSTAGERVLVYAQQGSGHVYVGQLHAGAGVLKLGLLPQVKGRGKLIAYYMRGRQPQGSATLATFADAASNGSEKPSHLKLHAGTLRWRAACTAASYAVALSRAGKTTTESTAKPELALPAGGGRTLVSIAALSSGGLTLGSIRKTLP